MGDATHQWKKAGHVAHKNVWKPKTKAGKKGVAAHIKRRKSGQA